MIDLDTRKFLIDFYKETFNLHHWTMTSKSIDYWEKLEESQWKSLEEIKSMQLDKLNRLLIYAYNNVPYYKKLFDKYGIKASQITTFSDFEKVPFLEKRTIKSDKNGDLVSRNIDYDKVLKIRTSGSTGMPLHIYADTNQLDWRYAAVIRYWGWTGWKFGDKSIRLWHQKIGMTEEQVKKEWLDSYLLNRKYIPVFDMNDKNLMKYLLEIIEYKPKIMDGYAEAFEIFADYIRVNDIDDVYVSVIISSAQMLSNQMREKIEKYMHSEVFDRYGCREFSTIAHECEKHKGYHITSENLLVEIIKDGKPANEGDIGEIVITDLNNYSQPMIRYKIGDLAEKINEKCICGRGLPLIGKIHGRTKGIIIGTNGKYLPTSFFLHYLKDYEDEIKQFQIIQEKRDLLLIKIIPQAQQVSRDCINRIKKDFHCFLGEFMKIEFIFVDKIEMVKTGKHQSVILKIPFSLNSINNDFIEQL